MLSSSFVDLLLLFGSFRANPGDPRLMLDLKCLDLRRPRRLHLLLLIERRLHVLRFLPLQFVLLLRSSFRRIEAPVLKRFKCGRFLRCGAPVKLEELLRCVFFELDLKHQENCRTEGAESGVFGHTEKIGPSCKTLGPRPSRLRYPCHFSWFPSRSSPGCAINRLIRKDNHSARGFALVPGFTAECFFAWAIICSTLSLPS